jgi:hypothetical protein
VPPLSFVFQGTSGEKAGQLAITMTAHVGKLHKNEWLQGVFDAIVTVL